MTGSDPSRSPTAPNAELVCSECGALDAKPIGDLMLCERCYSEKGSCCPEFGKDDLWAGRADAPACAVKPAGGGHLS